MNRAHLSPPLKVGVITFLIFILKIFFQKKGFLKVLSNIKYNNKNSH